MADEPLKDFIHILELMIENPYMGLIYVDTSGRVVLINQTYADIIGFKKEEAVGKHIHEVTPHSQLPEILQTEETHLADLWTVNGHDMIVTRTPIYDNGKLIGALGRSLFLDLSAAKILATKLNQLEDELAVYREEVKKIHTAKYFCQDLIGSSQVMQEVRFVAQKICRASSNVLITGETGTGKELLANAIHNASPRHGFPFIRVNCASLTSSLLESELFGYEDGAFTGAKKGGKVGRFELANHGTIFLDEVGEIPLEMQTKLLTFLQEREFERVGGTKTIKVDVRIIAATNLDLEQAVVQGKFRQDLYYRLNVMNINIPPLRKRKEDIQELSAYFILKLNQRLATRATSISREAMEALAGYEWPGNVRELENVLERAMLLADMNDETRIKPSHLPGILRKIESEKPAQAPGPTLDSILEEMEKSTIIQSLNRHQQDKAAVAKELGINLSALYRRLKKYGIPSGKN
ncbi:MAG: sigma 54-interacting transcriptional regulator [Firmicutes bacterium]|nr:sigma 54-interacting transcriptional regulator [Bacillota bacterium]